LGCQDKSFVLDGQKIPFPSASPIVPYIVDFFMSGRHKGVWRFNPSTIYGLPRPNPALPNDKPAKAVLAIPNSYKVKQDWRESVPTLPVLLGLFVAFALFFYWL
jgi:hypothetical protein